MRASGAMGLPGGSRLLVNGSTRPMEEAVVDRVLEKMRQHFAPLQVILAEEFIHVGSL